jgi:hypothetical protein
MKGHTAALASSSKIAVDIMIYMKRYLAILLFVLFPMQLSWAAVTGYCQHETDVSTKHVGHHSHEHPSEVVDNASATSAPWADLDHDCASCHSGCVTALASHQTLHAPMAAQAHLLVYQRHHTSWFKAPPVRPPWPQLA